MAYGTAARMARRRRCRPDLIAPPPRSRFRVYAVRDARGGKVRTRGGARSEAQGRAARTSVPPQERSMIASAPAAQAVDPPQVIVTYRDPSTVVRSVQVVAWSEGLPTVGGFVVDALSDDSPVRVACTPGAEIAVLFERDDGVYRADGPFVCPLRDGEHQMDPRWRR